MFKVAHYNPNDDQKWLITRFETFRFDESTFILDKFIPRPLISLIFHFDERPLIIENNPIVLEPFFVAPVIPKAIFLKFHGNMDVFIVACNPTVFSRIFNIDLSPVTKRSINLPADIFYPLWEEIRKIKYDEDRIVHFNNFITSRCRSENYQPDVIDILYQKIIEKSIKTPLHIIMEECGVSCRTLQRKFIKRTGVTPKVLMRIVRLNYLWTKINNHYAVNYQDLVFEGNFFDQAHFINDFKSIVGETPNHFFNRNLNIVELFSGKDDNNTGA